MAVKERPVNAGDCVPDNEACRRPFIVRQLSWDVPRHAERLDLDAPTQVESRTLIQQDIDADLPIQCSLELGALFGRLWNDLGVVKCEFADLSGVIFDPTGGTCRRGDERLCVLLYAPVGADVVVMTVSIEDDAHVLR